MPFSLLSLSGLLIAAIVCGGAALAGGRLERIAALAAAAAVALPLAIQRGAQGWPSRAALGIVDVAVLVAFVALARRPRRHGQSGRSGSKA